MNLTPLSQKLIDQMQARLPTLKQRLIAQFGDEGRDMSNPSDATGLCINLFIMQHKSFTYPQVLNFLIEFLAVPKAQVCQLYSEFTGRRIP